MKPWNINKTAPRLFITPENIAALKAFRKPVPVTKQELLNDWHDSDENGVYHVEEWRMSDGSIQQFVN